MLSVLAIEDYSAAPPLPRPFSLPLPPLCCEKGIQSQLLSQLLLLARFPLLPGCMLLLPACLLPFPVGMLLLPARTCCCCRCRRLH